MDIWAAGWSGGLVVLLLASQGGAAKRNHIMMYITINKRTLVVAEKCAQAR
jgi:hypothetical protein